LQQPFQVIVTVERDELGFIASVYASHQVIISIWRRQS